MKYMDLPQRGHIQAEYVWIDAIGGCRCKTKVCYLFSSLWWDKWTLLLSAISIVCARSSRMQLNVHASPPADVRSRDLLLTRSGTSLRPSRNSSLLSMSSPNGTSMVHQPVRLVVTTPMSTSAPLLSSPIPSAVATTSSSSVKLGIRMVPPTSSTTATKPTV